MIIAIVVFVGVYAYQLFSWEDIMPITLDEIPYMVEFTLSHIMYTFNLLNM